LAPRSPPSPCGTPILAASFTAYDPDFDPDGRFRTTAMEVIATAIEALSLPGSAAPSR
jgi:hypothetical protein